MEHHICARPRAYTRSDEVRSSCSPSAAGLVHMGDLDGGKRRGTYMRVFSRIHRAWSKSRPWLDVLLVLLQRSSSSRCSTTLRESPALHALPVCGYLLWPLQSSWCSALLCRGLLAARLGGQVWDAALRIRARSRLCALCPFNPVPDGRRKLRASGSERHVPSGAADQLVGVALRLCKKPRTHQDREMGGRDLRW